MEVTIRRAGMQTTVQDLGRPGYRAEGVPLSGAMDRFALRVANLLVGNPENAAALEFTLLGPGLQFSSPALVAVTGGDFGGELPMWQPVHVPARTSVRFSAARAGCRGYLAVAGGFQVPSVLGSASVYLRAGFGGWEGRALREGDVLPAPDLERHVEAHWWIDPRILPEYSSSPTIRVLRGAQAHEFGRTFFESTYRLTAQSDRMGLRLAGPMLVRQSQLELRSGPVVPGTVQVPPDGQPIVLMADAQTIGGYPQIAHVIRVDLPLVAQLRPGDTMSFAEVSLEDAHELALAREHALAMLRHGLAQKLG
jgi:antagonist of KipI